MSTACVRDMIVHPIRILRFSFLRTQPLESLSADSVRMSLKSQPLQQILVAEVLVCELGVVWLTSFVILCISHVYPLGHDMIAHFMKPNMTSYK